MCVSLNSSWPSTISSSTASTVTVWRVFQLVPSKVSVDGLTVRSSPAPSTVTVTVSDGSVSSTTV